MKKTFIYIFSLLLSLPYLYSCSDEQMPELLPIEDEGNSTVVEDDIDVSLLEPGFNLNPKDKSGNLPDADQPLDKMILLCWDTIRIVIFMPVLFLKVHGCMFLQDGTMIRKNVK